ncbi:MAG TPA: penicillin acylase family protein, partial [Candidatus Acidoferrales bacterium]|nr:penicillin acylase family protein [Candidatus Acidoferrales bacterium]
ARYRTTSGSGEITRHSEEHAVRLGSDVQLQWESCEHGILYPGWKHHDGVDLALRYAPSDAGRFFAGYLKLAEAKSVDDHRAALELINDGPFDFNHIYAHKDGHIAWEPYGRLPRRSQDGLFVRDAHDPQAQWNGFLPFTSNPKMINPERGFVASANSITDPSDYTALTTKVHAESRYRQTRIESYLGSTTQHTSETFAALQSDISSDYSVPLRDALVELLAPRIESSAGASVAALQQLREWDGRFDTESTGALVYALLQRELPSRCFGPLLGKDITRSYVNSRRAIPRLHKVLLDSSDPLRRNIERASGKTLAALFAEAFEAAVKRAVESFGNDPKAWHWKRAQFIQLNTPLGELPLIGRWFRALDAPFPGDFYTISPSIAVPVGNRLRAFAGATSRFICDLSRPDEALFSHCSGLTSDVGSTFFANLSQPWLRFEYFRSALWSAAEVPDAVERVVVPPHATAE